jgi:Mimiviridae putative ATP-dependent RNA helicase
MKYYIKRLYITYTRNIIICNYRPKYMDSNYDDILKQIDQEEAYRVLQNVYSNSVEKNGINNSIRFSEETEELLRSHQHMHVFNMISALNDRNNGAILDGSYTGTGKTYTTAAICKETKRQPFIICQKSNIGTWEKVLKLFDVEPLAVVNYEMVRTGKYYVDGEAIACPYVTREKSKFKWEFSEIGKKNMVMVFDEAHLCKNKSSLNSKLLTSCKAIKTIMLSATLCDKIEDFGVFGMMLGFYASVRAGKNWMENVIRREKCRLKVKGNNNTIGSNVLHKEIFNKRGSRMSYKDLGDDMSMNQISIECFTVDKKIKEKIDKLYEDVRVQKRKYEDFKGVDTVLGKDKKASALSAITFKREKIENVKADIIMEQALSYYESRMSIVIFINYRSTHQKICDAFTKRKIEHVMIRGDQSITEREEAIEMFQRNEVRVMVAMAQAGGSSISLHDTAGKFPRVSIISPSYSVIELVQILGRIRRTDTMSPTIQKIVYCSGTCEEHIAQKVREKEEIIGLMTGEASTKVLRTDKVEKKERSRDRASKHAKVVSTANMDISEVTFGRTSGRTSVMTSVMTSNRTSYDDDNSNEETSVPRRTTRPRRRRARVTRNQIL